MAAVCCFHKTINKKCPEDCDVRGWFPLAEVENFKKMAKYYGGPTDLVKKIREGTIEDNREAFIHSLQFEVESRGLYPIHGSKGRFDAEYERAQALQDQVAELQHEIDELLDQQNDANELFLSSERELHQPTNKVSGLEKEAWKWKSRAKEAEAVQKEEAVEEAKELKGQKRQKS